jgi:hypothetical protein
MEILQERRAVSLMLCLNNVGGGGGREVNLPSLAEGRFHVRWSEGIVT